jgi:hypothetical protein
VKAGGQAKSLKRFILGESGPNGAHHRHVVVGPFDAPPAVSG